MGLIISMWSGPRNISTALMRAWENRSDTEVWDEPLYPCYLSRTMLDHPGRDHVLSAHADEVDYDFVARRLVSGSASSVFYQKHMAHHLLDGMNREWMDDPAIVHCFLLREPREMILSLHARYPAMELEDTGLPQQVEIFNRVRERGIVPPVVDARDVLEDPEQTLGLLCKALGVPFEDSMLSWPAGPRESDGAWADFWYDSVRQSTGFEPWRPRDGELSPRLLKVYEQCRPLYDELHQYLLKR